MRLKKANGSNAHLNNCHRLKTARLTAEMSLRSVARRMNVTMATARAEEEGNCNLCISDLYRWQRALQVPLTELLEPPSTGLSEPVRQRACLVRLAKTAKTLLTKCSHGANHRLVSRMVDQLHELMPELREVGTWPEGRPRPLDDLGRTADEILTSEWFSARPLD